MQQHTTICPIICAYFFRLFCLFCCSHRGAVACVQPRESRLSMQRIELCDKTSFWYPVKMRTTIEALNIGNVHKISTIISQQYYPVICILSWHIPAVTQNTLSPIPTVHLPPPPPNKNFTAYRVLATHSVSHSRVFRRKDRIDKRKATNSRCSDTKKSSPSASPSSSRRQRAHQVVEGAPFAFVSKEGGGGGGSREEIMQKMRSGLRVGFNDT